LNDSDFDSDFESHLDLHDPPNRFHDHNQHQLMVQAFYSWIVKWTFSRFHENCIAVELSCASVGWLAGWMVGRLPLLEIKIKIEAGLVLVKNARIENLACSV